MHILQPVIGGLAVCCAMACAAGEEPLPRTALEQRIASSGAETIGVYFRDLQTGEELQLNADVRMHAASTMKVPVMIQLFRDRDAGLLSLEDSLEITKTFQSRFAF